MATKESNNDKAIASKLHRQFAHPNPNKLIRLIRNSSINSKNLEKEVLSNSKYCITCTKFKKPSSRPVVCLPMAKEFNETVSMDLKVWKQCYFLVIVDLATRFCTATVVNNKQPSTIIKGLFVSWITIFGAPKRILTDGGGEFNNAEMRALGEAFNIKIITTAAESPWSNGVCERLNGVLGNLVMKILDDKNCDIQMALAWAVSARNAYDNNSGYSPNQLVFGFNPAIPDIYNSRIPGLEEVTMSEIVRRNLNALHLARQEFVKFESDEKIKRALRHNVRKSNIDDLSNGDEVYYKRNDANEWRGPGKVIDIDGKIVIVKHGGHYVKVHIVSLVKKPTKDPSDEIDEDVPLENTKVSKDPSKTQGMDLDDPSKIQGMDPHETDIIDLDEIDETHVGLHPLKNQGIDLDDPSKIQGMDLVEADGRLQVSKDPLKIQGMDLDDPSKIQGMDPNETMVRLKKAKGKAKTKNTIGVWKKGQRFQGIDDITGEHISGKILNRAGKVRGANRDCYNIRRDSDGWQGWLNLRSIKDLSVVPDTTEMIILFNSNEVAIAKEKEIQNWKENNVFEEVEDRKQKAITVRWVITEKVKEGRPITKARLVARGFEENTSSLRKDSPTCSREAIRILIAIASSKRWDCNTVDVKSAYLQGNSIQRKLYLKPPPEFNNGSLWKLNKTVYGLCDAAREWYMRVKDELNSLSVKMCSLDNSLFVWNRNGKLEGLICIYVDDFLWTGTNEFKEQVINELKEKFLIGSSASVTFTYVGLSIRSFGDGITIDQTQYISSLMPIPISRTRAIQKKSELSQSEKTAYRALVGQLNWVATHTRPDVAFETCELSVSYSKATMAELLKLNKLVERVKRECVNLFFPRLQSLETCILEVYADAAFRNLPGEASQGGLIIFLKDETGQRCPIFWQSRKLDRVVNSTLAAETLALVEGAGATVNMEGIIKELTGLPDIKIHCYIDNKSLVESLSSSKQVKDRRLRLDTTILENMMAREEINKIFWVKSSDQLADCLTKKGVCTDKLRDAVSRS